MRVGIASLISGNREVEGDALPSERRGINMDEIARHP